SPTLTQTVTPAATTATVTSSPNPAVFGQAVTFTATVNVVAPGAATPTGTVTLRDGTTALLTATLSATGTVMFSVSGLAVGNRSMNAVYSGDTNFAGSTSATLTQAVNQGATTTAVASSLNPSTFGQTVIFTATVTPVAPAAGTPTGTVTFFDGTAPLGS